MESAQYGQHTNLPSGKAQQPEYFSLPSIRSRKPMTRREYGLTQNYVAENENGKENEQRSKPNKIKLHQLIRKIMASYLYSSLQRKKHPCSRSRQTKTKTYSCKLRRNKITKTASLNQNQQQRCDYVRIENQTNPLPNCFRFHLA